VITSLAMRARANHLLRELQAAADPQAARASIAGVLPERIAAVLVPDDLESMRRRLKMLPAPPEKIAPTRDELLHALAICLLVFVSTLPVTIPFMIAQNAHRALRMSNAIALVMLFLLGHSLGKYTGGRSWRLGFGMLLIGGVLVASTIALGG
jgi:VIT1/CCC1 family predicted Fe2+/Mn2+ transporter